MHTPHVTTQVKVRVSLSGVGAAGTRRWNQPFTAVVLTDGDVPGWWTARRPLTSWLRHANTPAICCICRDPQLRGEEEKHASVAAGTHMLANDVGSWHGQDFRFEPSVTDYFPPLIRFPGSLQESVWAGRVITEGGCRAATGFPRAQFSSDCWNVSQGKEGGPRGLVQVAPTINPAQLPSIYSLLH